MAVSGAKERIDAALQGWSGITSQPHRFGGTEYCLGRREIGHIHGDSLVDIPFPKKVRDELVTAGRAEPHHILPKSGWVSIFLGSRLTWIGRSNCSTFRTKLPRNTPQRNDAQLRWQPQAPQ